MLRRIRSWFWYRGMAKRGNRFRFPNDRRRRRNTRRAGRSFNQREAERALHLGYASGSELPVSSSKSPGFDGVRDNREGYEDSVRSRGENPISRTWQG